jgi:UDP:flavonoid glycosyltransferase YjiC (YdhE family)
MNLHEGRPLKGPFRDWVDGADQGVVLFSLGYTGFKPKDVPKHLISAFLEAFSKLKQRVIMRFDASLVEIIPDNVLIVSWFPQHDLLAHNNTMLFVTHCGMTGVLESVYHRVPMLALPIFGDQPDNAARLVERSLALRLDRWLPATGR